jgi:hypothetical protein
VDTVRLLASARRRSFRLAGASLVAVPLLMGSCDPSCEPPPGPRIIEQVAIGTSVQDRPITAFRVGTPGGTPVLAVGAIHGDEEAGIEIVEHLRDAAPLPSGLDIWIIPSMNPDGNVHGWRTNARGVDLNRNFAVNWQQIDCTVLPNNCSGPSAASEPETVALQDFARLIGPRLTIVYHGADHLVSAALNSVDSPDAVTAYAAAAGYRLGTIPCSPACTGTATQYLNGTLAVSSAFVVELSTKAAGGISDQGVNNHVNAFLAAAAEV